MKKQVPQDNDTWKLVFAGVGEKIKRWWLGVSMVTAMEMKWTHQTHILLWSFKYNHQVDTVLPLYR